MTRLEQTIDEMAEHYRLIGGRAWARANRFVLFTNLDLFNAKIERKPMEKIYPDYRHYLSDKCEEKEKENVRALRFIFNKLIANQFYAEDEFDNDKRAALDCIRPDVTSSFDAVFNGVFQNIYTNYALKHIDLI